MTDRDSCYLKHNLPARLDPRSADRLYGERSANELARGAMEAALITGKQGYMPMIPANGDSLLAVIVEASARRGLILPEARRAANAIGRVR